MESRYGDGIATIVYDVTRLVVWVSSCLGGADPFSLVLKTWAGGSDE